MKRFMMQMMRTMVTVIVVGTMALMIFSLRGELAETKAKLVAAKADGEPGLFETIAARTGVYPGEDRVAVVREVLAIPEGYAPLNVIPLGYPAENLTPKDKWNPSKVHYDKW